MIKRENKRGQITIFIVVAILVIAAAALLYLFAPGVKTIISDQPENPEEFIRTCLEEDIRDNVEIISLQGGIFNPSENSVSYNGIPVEYLCYTNEILSGCDILQPLLQPFIENEIKMSIENEVDFCFDAMATSYEEQGYQVQINPGEPEVNLLPGRISTNLNYEVLLTKEGSEKFEQFNIILNNNLYELVGIVNDMLLGVKMGGSINAREYAFNYYWMGLNINPNNVEEDRDSIVYSITEEDTETKFNFAVRSYVWEN